jgi:DNA invertase Pin-like site-specific DNA recombinase
MKSAIAYVRVSTDRQGKSGLGIEAQQAAINAFCQSYGYELIDVIIEIETGKGSDALRTRPQLATALEIARLTGAVIVSAKLDRITRNVAFGATLFQRTDISFRIADMPNADNFQINIMLSVAQLEAEMISKRTKAALQAARERGQVLGGGQGALVQKNAAAAFAEGFRAIVAPMSHLPVRAIAAELNARGLKTATGADWAHATTHRLIQRLAA